MNTKAILTTFAIAAAIGMIAVAHADTGGITNQNSGGPQRGGLPSLQNGNQIHPAVNAPGSPGVQPNYNPTENCRADGHSNIGEPCTG